MEMWALISYASSRVATVWVLLLTKFVFERRDEDGKQLFVI
jgi:hypothetical protein